MRAIQQILHGLRHVHHFVLVMHFDGDLVQRHFFGFKAARATFHDGFAIAGFGGVQGDVHAIDRAALGGLGIGAFGFGALGHDPNHAVIRAAYPDGLADGRFQWE